MHISNTKSCHNVKLLAFIFLKTKIFANFQIFISVPLNKGVFCNFRHRKYLQMCCKGKIEPEKMAPTERAAIFHGLGVHFQIVNWKLLSDTEEEFQIKAEDWGWKVKDSTMYPIKTDQAIAPESLLKVIRCNCKSKSKLQCTANLCPCRKHGLTCISSCEECHSELCDNREVQNYCYCSFLVKVDLRPPQHLR